MRERARVFTYTAGRGGYLSAMAPLLGLAAFEFTLFGLLVVFLVPPLVFKVALFGVLIAIAGYGAAVGLSPLLTHHSLSSSHLYLRYGLLLNADVSRDIVTGARPANRGEIAKIPGAPYEAKKQRVIAVLSPQWQVLLELSRPQRFRVGLFGGGLATSVLINVDLQDELLAALATRENLDAREASIEDRTRDIDRRVPTSNEWSLVVDQPMASVTIAAHLSAGANDHLPPAIRVENLLGTYGDFTAVEDLNVTVPPGEIYGFLGPNGAGKTTAIKMMVGLHKPKAGRIAIAGHDVWAAPLPAKASFGYVADRAILYDRLTGREFLEFLSQVRRMPEKDARDQIEYLLAALEMAEQAGNVCESYSFGMKRKIVLAGALLHRPKVLILDEPLNGLDPRSAHRLKELIAGLAAGGTAVFLSTHDLATAEAICHRVGIIHRARLIAEGSTAELRQLAAAPDLEAVFMNLTEEESEATL